jgi:putative spermidine/putrescine transport system substrate-binding protein
MTRFVRLLAVVSVLAVVAAACGDDEGGGDGGDGDGGGAQGVVTELGEGEGQVNIIAWAGYIEDGSTDPNYDWVTQFESDTGCQVNIKTAGTSDEMVALMQQGGGEYDLVTASGDASLRLIAGGTVQPINTDLIPSYDTVDERLQDAPWFTVDTDGDGTMEHYGVPYQWGSNVLLYNDEIFGGQAPTSWNVVFEEQTLPDGASNAGRVQAYDGAIYIADAALYPWRTTRSSGSRTRTR